MSCDKSDGRPLPPARTVPAPGTQHSHPGPRRTVPAPLSAAASVPAGTESSVASGCWPGAGAGERHKQCPRQSRRATGHGARDLMGEEAVGSLPACARKSLGLRRPPVELSRGCFADSNAPLFQAPSISPAKRKNTARTFMCRTSRDSRRRTPWSPRASAHASTRAPSGQAGWPSEVELGGLVC